MYDIVFFLSISVLKTWLQKQDSSLVYLGKDGRGRTGRGREGCPEELLQYLFIYLQFYTVVDLSVTVLRLFVLLFLLWFRYPPIFFYVFSVLVFCVFLGEGHVVSPPSVCSPSI